MTHADPGPTALSADRKRELLARAHDLSAELAGGQVGRSELGLVLSVLFRVAGSWEDRLDEAQKLLGALHHSGLMERDKAMPAKYRQLEQSLKGILAGQPSADELRFLLGWTDRWLKIRDQRQREEQWAKEKASDQG